MAITIYRQADLVSSTKSDIIFDVITDSTDITTKIVCEIFYRTRQDSFYRLAGSKEQNKLAGYNYFRFNLAGALNNLLTENYQESSTGIKTNIDKSSLDYFVVFTEYYPSTAFVAEDTLTSGVYYANNVGILKTEVQGTYTGSDWYMDGTASHKFLTDSQSSQLVRASERLQLGFLTSFSDPVVKLKETKNNLSTNTVTHAIGNQTYNKYLWDYYVDEDEVVSIGTEGLYASTVYITSLTGTSFYKYMPDNLNRMWGGVRMVATNDILEIVLPVLAVVSADLTVNAIAKTSNCDIEIYYKISGVWTISAFSPSTISTLGFANVTETMPAGATDLRIKKLSGGEVWIPFSYVTYLDNNAQNKRCQFTIDTTHIDSDTYKLEAWVEDGSSNIISEIKEFVVDTSRADATSRFAFRNIRGDFDHVTFTQGHQESLIVDKVRMMSELPIDFDTADEQTSVAFVNSEQVFTSFTEFETNEKLTWLKSLIESRRIYLIVSDVRYAVDILTSEVKYVDQYEHLQFEIQWRFSAMRNV